ncbi:MAG TPA: DUF2798 domain-containing protein [Lachnospiraceae bacterium]
MPKTKFQNIIFTLIMALIMVYCMICYNISISMGQLTNHVFLIALYELPIMWLIAFFLEFFLFENLAKKLAFRIVNPTDKPIFILLAISSMIVCLMCPSMSLIATLLFKKNPKDFLATWLQTTILNFPAALCLQIFFVGPFVRQIFSLFQKNR